MSYTTSTSSTDIRASADRVWAAVTRPDLVAQWQYGSQLITDWSIGGPIRFVSAWEGQTFEQWGTVLEFEPVRRLSYTLFAPRADLADLPENYFTMTYALEPVGEQTRITITQVDPRAAAGSSDDGFDGAEFSGEEEDDEFAADGDDGEDSDGDSDAESPVLVALRRLCEE